MAPRSVNGGVTAETPPKKGAKRERPETTLEQRVALMEAPPLKDLNIKGQEKHIWFTDGRSPVGKGNRYIKYGAVNLEEEIVQGHLDRGSAWHAKLHAIYQVLRQREDAPKPAYMYADSDFCVKGTQRWMFDWKRREWKGADGKAIANIKEWKWIYDWVPNNPSLLKIRPVKARGKGADIETIRSHRADAVARQYETAKIAVVTRGQQPHTPNQASNTTPSVSQETLKSRSSLMLRTNFCTRACKELNDG